MAFVNERITDQTPEKALIKALEKKYNIAIIEDASIDRERCFLYNGEKEIHWHYMSTVAPERQNGYW